MQSFISLNESSCSSCSSVYIFTQTVSLVAVLVMLLLYFAMALLPVRHVHVSASPQSRERGGQSEAKEVLRSVAHTVEHIQALRSQQADNTDRGLPAHLNFAKEFKMKLMRSHSALHTLDVAGEGSASQVQGHSFPKHNEGSPRHGQSDYAKIPEFTPSDDLNAEGLLLPEYEYFGDNDDIAGDPTEMLSMPSQRPDSRAVKTKNSMSTITSDRSTTNTAAENTKIQSLKAWRNRNLGSGLGSGSKSEQDAQMLHRLGGLDRLVDERNIAPFSSEQKTSSSRQSADQDEHPSNATQEADDDFEINKRTSSRCHNPDVFRDDLPWTCRQTWRWRHLGEQRYPSRIYEAVCEESSCYYGHYRCTPVTYTLKILQVCPNACEDDERVPYPLRTMPRMRTRWQYTDVNVTVGCMCTR